MTKGVKTVNRLLGGSKHITRLAHFDDNHTMLTHSTFVNFQYGECVLQWFATFTNQVSESNSLPSL